jgi:hypothetical protein
MTDNFTILGSLCIKLHQDFVVMYYELLPLFFALALVMDWFRNPQGSPDFLETIKRAVISTLLIAAYPQISNAILAITSGIADRISDLSGIDTFIQMASEKAKSYPHSSLSILMGLNDFVLALLSFASYLIVYFARYIIVAVYHFMFILLSILAPLLILFTLFRGTTQITVNLFKSLIEVASYKIIWAVMSAMLTSLAFGQAYTADGGYLTVIVLNFVIAVALLCTPLIVHSIVGSGLSAVGQTLSTAAAAAMVAAPAKVAMGTSFGLDVFKNPGGFGSHLKNQFKPRGRFDYTSRPQSPPPPLSSSSTPPPVTSPSNDIKVQNAIDRK